MAQEVQCSFQRYEKKYLLDAGQYDLLRSSLAEYTEEDRYGRYTICNIYYDTPDFQLIRRSLEKPIYKEKLRVRSYGVPGEGDPVFVELKRKFDGVVYKRRTVTTPQGAVDLLAAADPGGRDQISREILWFRDRWQPRPRVYLAYDREALSGKEDSRLRITFDTGLRWREEELDLRAGDYGAPILPEDKVLMEIKLPGVAPVWLAHLLSRERIFPVSFSKYGTCYLNDLAPEREDRAGRESKEKGKEVGFCA